MNILLVEDDSSHAELIQRSLERSAKWHVRRAANASRALSVLDREPVELVLLDYSLPDQDGLELLDRIRRRDADLPVIFLTAADSAEICVRAMKGGALDYVLKKRNYLDRLSGMIRKALSERPKSVSAGESPSLRAIVGTSPLIQAVRRDVQQAARSDANVLIEGDTGTGKELVARATHDSSRRQAAPYLAVNCAEVPETLFESEFFGSVRGAFTGAVSDRRGLLETAGRGTLMLDEIEALALPNQSKLLRVLQTREFKPVGSTRFLPLRARIIAASNETLELLVERNVFRRDLFYRLDVLRIHVPRLRERRDDIPLLVRHFIGRFNERNGTSFPAELSPETMNALRHYTWPGNVRELENLIERTLVNSPPGRINETPLITSVLSGKGPDDRTRILEALRVNRWNREQTSRMLGCSRATLWRKMSRYGLK